MLARESGSEGDPRPRVILDRLCAAHVAAMALAEVRGTLPLRSKRLSPRLAGGRGGDHHWG